MLKYLTLRHFRNYSNAEVAFSPGLNWIQGNNGQGKTNLLEAIYLLSTGRSFRSNTLSDLISWGESFFYVEGIFERDGVEQTLKVYYDLNTRRIQYNETIFSTLTSLMGILPSVLLSPDDLSLVGGTPAERRKFIDMHIAQTDALYIHHLGRYFKGMKQRNTLLKAKSDAAISSWEQMMAHSADYLVKKRADAAEALKSPATRWMQLLSNAKDSMNLEYEKSLSSEFEKAWQRQRPREMMIGSTLQGPHRDDLSITLGEKKAKTFSSEGQKRSCICALRFAQWELMRECLGYPPLLSIDDFGVQLDRERQRQLKHHLNAFAQVFLSSPQPWDEQIPHKVPPRIFHVENGMLSQ